MKHKWTDILVYLILILGILFRFMAYGQIPSSLNRDEAALGYNAFTIRTTGNDEWGNFLPLVFRSFGDYKLPGYIYFDVVFNALFGNSNLAVRLPSLLAGLGILSLTYFWIKELTKNPGQALVATAFMAIQPWSIFYSRMAYEAHLGLFFFILSFYSFWKKRKYSHLLGLTSFLLAIFTYNTPLILAPLLSLFIFIFQPKKSRWWAIGGVCLITILGLSIFRPLTAQKQNITLFSDPTIAMEQSQAYSQSTSRLQQIYNNRYLYKLRAIGSRFLASLKPNFMLFNGGQNPWHNAPNTGHILITTYFLSVLSGIFGLKNFKKSWKWGLMFGITLLPAIITVDAPHATRSLLFLFGFSLMSLLAWTKLKTHSKGVVLILMLVESLVYAKKYFIDFPEQMTRAWPNGIEQALSEAKTINNEASIIISDATGADLTYDQIYIFPLYYYGVNQNKYQETRFVLPNDAANLSRIGGFYGVSISGYNQVNHALNIERNKDGNFYLK